MANVKHEKHGKHVQHKVPSNNATPLIFRVASVRTHGMHVPWGEMVSGIAEMARVRDVLPGVSDRFTVRLQDHASKISTITKTHVLEQVVLNAMEKTGEEMFIGEGWGG